MHTDDFIRCFKYDMNGMTDNEILSYILDNVQMPVR